MKLLSTQDIQSTTGNTTPAESTLSAGSDQILLDLGPIPIVNQYHETRQEALDAERYDLCAVIKEDKTIHLTVQVPPEILYKGYRYNSKVNIPYQIHCEKMFKSFEHLLYSSSRTDTIIDIGGNDGTLLKTFDRLKKNPLNLINVDASDSFAAENEAAGITYVNAFFSDELDLPKAAIITSTNVFQHTKDIHKFLR
ncbi:MAG: hypothetical protein ACO23R_19175, partial [bacterium]